MTHAYAPDDLGKHVVQEGRSGRPKATIGAPACEFLGVEPGDHIKIVEDDDALRVVVEGER